MAKLVEILARELKEWPDCKHGEKVETKALTQDDNGRINTLDSGCFAEQDQFSGGVWLGAQWTWIDLDFEIAEDYTTAIVTRAEWQAAVDALKPDAQRFAEDYVEANKDRSVKEWNGEGLPPVGTVCEWAGCTYAPEDPKEPDLHVGDQVKIIAHFKDGEFDLAAFTFNPGIHNSARGAAWVNQGSHGCFRPIRTPEQIAAEEREKAVRDMLLCLKSPLAEATAYDLYDAGYRKQEQK